MQVRTGVVHSTFLRVQLFCFLLGIHCREETRNKILRAFINDVMLKYSIEIFATTQYLRQTTVDGVSVRRRIMQ